MRGLSAVKEFRRYV